MITPNIWSQIESRLLALPKEWDGRRAILEMKNDGYPHWKQMEWIGFYFQYLCEKKLGNLIEIPGPRYGRSQFDGFYKIPWDFKSHAINTMRHDLIINDRLAIERAIKEYGQIGVIIALGEAKYNDEDRSFQMWHQQLKGGLSRYEEDRIRRGASSRLRKVHFSLRQIALLAFTEQTLSKSGSFQRNFRNANGRPRQEKVMINLTRAEDFVVQWIDFS